MKKQKEYPVFHATTNKNIGQMPLPHSFITTLSGGVKPLEVSTENANDCKAFSEKLGINVDLILFDVKDEKIWIRPTPKKKYGSSN